MNELVVAFSKSTTTRWGKTGKKNLDFLRFWVRVEHQRGTETPQTQQVNAAEPMVERTQFGGEKGILGSWGHCQLHHQELHQSPLSLAGTQLEVPPWSPQGHGVTPCVTPRSAVLTLRNLLALPTAPTLPV